MSKRKKRRRRSRGKRGCVEVKPTSQVLVAVVEKDGLILVAHRGPGCHMENHWEFPGAKIKYTQNHENTLGDIYRDNFGIKIRVNHKITSYTVNFTRELIEIQAYYADYVEGDFILDVHDQMRWISPGNLRDLEFTSADIPILDEIM